MRTTNTLDQGGFNRIVINQILQCLTHFRLGQFRNILVSAQIVDAAFRSVDDAKLTVLAKLLDVARFEIACNINISSLKQQALRHAFLHMTIDDALHRGLRV